MACVNKDAKGWRIRFTDHNGEKRCIRPGKVPESTAVSIKGHIEKLVVSKAANQVVELHTAKWLAGIGDSLHMKLLKIGLVEPRIDDAAMEPEVEIVRLHDFVAEFIQDGKTAKGTNAADATILNWKTTQTYLKDYFSNVDIGSITPRQAKQFRQWLESKTIGEGKRPLSESARRKHIAIVKQLFTAAMRLDLIQKNPFAHEISGNVTNRTRDFYITPEMTEKLLTVAPDHQWRLMIALWRLAGLRKMEIFALKWQDILWDQSRMFVRSSKTAHHEGKGSRFVPIGTVEKYLAKAFEAAESVTEAVITRFSPSNVNLHKPFLKIVENAGLIAWPKLFQNLRASCETQWLDSGLPAHVVANWMGHSVKVQNNHYAQVDDHHFDRFNEVVANCGHFLATTTSEVTRNREHEADTSGSRNSVFTTRSRTVASVRASRVAVEGLEPTSKKTA
jgi:integrase